MSALKDKTKAWVTLRMQEVFASVSCVDPQNFPENKEPTRVDLIAKIMARIESPDISDRDFNAHVKLLAEMSGYLKKRADVSPEHESDIDSADIDRPMTAEEAKIEYMRMLGHSAH